MRVVEDAFGIHFEVGFVRQTSQCRGQSASPGKRGFSCEGAGDGVGTEECCGSSGDCGSDERYGPFLAAGCGDVEWGAEDLVVENLDSRVPYMFDIVGQVLDLLGWPEGGRAWIDQ